jgi:(4S)-4-hydroxy-5-phosphonooxypentane-2,3-dione isomerase
MHVVLVQVRVRPELLEEFERALLHNASQSVKHDPGCLRFDVGQAIEDPLRWVLYEVYDRAESHAAHRKASHFLAYDAVAERAVTEKVLIRYVGKHVTETGSGPAGV